MTISASDVKLLKSQRLTDENDGGGRATGQAVTDGEVNNLFPDISRLDRTLGRISLRKAFAGVLTENADAYLGAHCILTQAPTDPRVSVVLFNSGSQTDTRADAQSAIENYVVPATAAQFELLGNQLAGQRAITCVQREEHTIPEIGQVYRLVWGTNSQYVRLTSVDWTVENFIYEYSNGQYLTLPRRRLQLGISSPLLTYYPGGTVTPGGTSATNTSGEAKSTIQATQVADAAKYYGISKASAPLAEGDLTVRVESVYAPLVPSTTKETALLDQLGGYSKREFRTVGPARNNVALSFASVTGGQSRAFLGTGVKPGTLVLTINGGVYSDDSRGELRFTSGSNTLTKATIDYATGEINAYRATVFTGTASANYTPATAVSGNSVSGAIGITLSSRGYVYTLNLAEAKPRPGTLTISYMALGKWQEISDPGNGELTGQGSGSITFGTGSVSITLQALPDVGSSLIFNYISDRESAYNQQSGSAVTAEIRVRHTLPHEGIKPGSLSATYVVGGTTKTFTDNGQGVVSGDATGTIIYASGKIDVKLSATPDSGTSIKYNYQQGANQSSILSPNPDSSGLVTGTVPGAPLQPGTVEASWSVIQRNPVPSTANQTTYETNKVIDRTAVDNGAGGWVGYSGTIDYNTGAFTLRVENSYTYQEYRYEIERSGWALAAVSSN